MSEAENKNTYKQINSYFTTNFYSKILEENSDENFIFSPFSIQVLLAMIHAGTDGETANEISKLFQFNNISHIFKEILDTNVNNGQLYIANKIYAQNDIEFIDEFKKIAKEYFHSETENVDFTKMEEISKNINNWIADKTTGKVQNIVQSDKLQLDTNLALISSLYLKANWRSKFHKKMTYKGDFLNNDNETIKVKMMSASPGRYDYCELEDLNAKALVRLYEDEHLKILFIVPNENSNLNELEKNMNKINLFDICEKMKSTLVKLRIPKFTIDCENDLVKLVTKMGISNIFEDQANFTSSMATNHPIKISKIIHKICFDVNEEGTEATPPKYSDFQICIYPLRLSETPREFFLNRPFLYAVIDDTTIYYIGRVKSLTAVSNEDNLKYVPENLT